MSDKILIFLSSLMVSIILALVSLDYPKEYEIFLGIIATTGAIVAIYEFFRNR